MLKGEAHMI